MRIERAALEGRYVCSEGDGSEIEIVLAGGVLHGGFTGMFGTGRMERLERPLTTLCMPDLWLFPCPRALDYTAPGDWTLLFERDEEGSVKSVRIGCWLARSLTYVKTPALA